MEKKLICAQQTNLSHISSSWPHIVPSSSSSHRYIVHLDILISPHFPSPQTRHFPVGDEKKDGGEDDDDIGDNGDNGENGHCGGGEAMCQY